MKTVSFWGKPPKKPNKKKPRRIISPFVKLTPYHKNRTKKDYKLIARKPFGDKDKDKIMNIYDCKPFHRKQQGWVGGHWMATPKEKKKAYHKLRKAGLSSQMADRVSRWRPTKQKMVLEQGTMDFEIELEKKRIARTGFKTPKHLRDYQNKRYKQNPEKIKENIERYRNKPGIKENIAKKAKEYIKRPEVIARMNTSEAIAKRRKADRERPREIKRKAEVRERKERISNLEAPLISEEEQRETAQDLVDDVEGEIEDDD